MNLSDYPAASNPKAFELGLGDIPLPYPDAGAAGQDEEIPRDPEDHGHFAFQPDSKPTDEELNLTDVGNGKRLVQAHGLDLRFCHPWRQWLVFYRTHWRFDDCGRVDFRAKNTIDTLFKTTAKRIEQLGHQVKSRKNPTGQQTFETQKQIDELNRVLKWCLRSEEARRIKSMLEMAKSEHGIPIMPQDLDAEPFLLNCRNGTVNLRNGILQSHYREDYITKICPVAFDANATCPLWIQSLNRWMNGNTDLVEYLQRVVGYALTADTREQCLWFLYGTGENGKSTFLNVLREMLGDYSLQAVSELLMQKRNEQHPTERADLLGKRFVATIEVDQGKHIAEALVKQLTGGEGVRARKMRQDFTHIDETWKIFLAANYKPTIRGNDRGIWRRIKVIPFEAAITEEEKDKNLKDKLKRERPGILNWAIQGCLAWQKFGLGEPDEVTHATTEYKAEQDCLSEFIRELCFVNIQARCRVRDLFKAFQEYSGDKLITEYTFKTSMKARGYESKPGHGGVYYWHGIGINPTE